MEPCVCASRIQSRVRNRQHAESKLFAQSVQAYVLLVANHRASRFAKSVAQQALQLVHIRRARQHNASTDHCNRLLSTRSIRRRLAAAVGNRCVSMNHAAYGRFSRLCGQVLCGLLRILFDHDMNIQAADAKRVHRSATRRVAIHRRPRFAAMRNIQRNLRPRNCFTKVLNIDRRRNRLMLNRKDRFHHSSQPSGFERMPDIRLHTADRNALAFDTILRKELRKSFHFGRITDLSARCMCLNHLH